nr:hypothetical protein [uncultured Flavobacterium sp.]
MLFLLCNYLNAQTLQGTVTDANGIVTNVNVIIKKPQLPNLIFQFSKTNDKGVYSVILNKPLDSIIVEIQSYKYEPIRKKLDNIHSKGKIITLNFYLEPRVTTLKEVVVSNYNPIKVKKDTITYDVQKFKNGSEKVVEDLLKNLPGFEVKNNGEIKYKGKGIKKMLLDGDDLFDSQYTIGSKNIDVELLDKVEAIENYNENALLKGLVSSDDVAINLKLKKGKTDLSGNANFGLGYKNKYNTSVSGMLINSKTKTFGIASANNIGINNSPFDFQSNILSVESMKDQNLTAKELINQGSFYSLLDDKFHRINNNFYTSINSLYKFTSKITAKVNLGFYSDKLTQLKKQESFFDANNESFTSTQSEDMSRSPKIYNGNFQFINNVNKSLNWEYLGKFNYQDVHYKSISSNNTLLQLNNVSTKNWLSKNNFYLTKRLNNNNAITALIYYTNSRAPQHYTVTPGVNINGNGTDIIKENNQESRFDKEIFNSNVLLLNKYHDFKFALRAGFYAEKNSFRSLLETINTNDESYTNQNFQNNLTYNYSFPYIDGGATFNKKKFSFKVNFSSQYLDLKVNNEFNNMETLGKTIFNPSLKFLYRFTEHTNLVSSYSYNQIAPQETNLFEGIVQTDFGSFINNEANLQFLKTHNYGINLNYNDSYYFTNLSLGLNYNQRQNNYFYKSLINQYYTTSTAFLLNSGNRDYGVNFSGQKYIYFLRTDFKINSNYSISLDKNSINNSELRDVKSKNFMLDLTAKTAFTKNTYIENTVSYRFNSYALDGVNQNYFSSINDSFRAVLKPSQRFKTTLALNFIIPDLQLSQNYWFLDSEFTFTSKNKKIDYSIIGRNLTNNTSFQTVSITDYEKTISSHNLINRFVAVNVAFRF